VCKQHQKAWAVLERQTTPGAPGIQSGRGELSFIIANGNLVLFKWQVLCVCVCVCVCVFLFCFTNTDSGSILTTMLIEILASLLYDD
jgi:hypothetical protein